jgi:hypothetical protein
MPNAVTAWRGRSAGAICWTRGTSAPALVGPAFGNGAAMGAGDFDGRIVAWGANGNWMETAFFRV